MKGNSLEVENKFFINKGCPAIQTSFLCKKVIIGNMFLEIYFISVGFPSKKVTSTLFSELLLCLQFPIKIFIIGIFWGGIFCYPSLENIYDEYNR